MMLLLLLSKEGDGDVWVVAWCFLGGGGLFGI